MSLAQRMHFLQNVIQMTAGMRGTHCVMVKALDCGIVVGEFELLSQYDVHFQTNTLGKGMDPLILPAMG